MLHTRHRKQQRKTLKFFIQNCLLIVRSFRFFYWTCWALFWALMIFTCSAKVNLVTVTITTLLNICKKKSYFLCQPSLKWKFPPLNFILKNKNKKNSKSSAKNAFWAIVYISPKYACHNRGSEPFIFDEIMKQFLCTLTNYYYWNHLV